MAIKRSHHALKYLTYAKNSLIIFYVAYANNKQEDNLMEIEKVKPSTFSEIKHTIGVMSGKGGVGKSSVTSLIASELNKQGFSVGIFGEGNLEKSCKELGIDMLDKLPINKDFIALSDQGNIQKFDALNLLSKTLDKILD